MLGHDNCNAGARLILCCHHHFMLSLLPTRENQPRSFKSTHAVSTQQPVTLLPDRPLHVQHWPPSFLIRLLMVLIISYHNMLHHLFGSLSNKLYILLKTACCVFLHVLYAHQGWKILLYISLWLLQCLQKWTRNFVPSVVCLCIPTSSIVLIHCMALLTSCVFRHWVRFSYFTWICCNTYALFLAVDLTCLHQI